MAGDNDSDGETKDYSIVPPHGRLTNGDYIRPNTKPLRVIEGAFSIIDSPVTLFREKFVQPLKEKLRGPKPVYYHRQFPRVPSIDECYENDLACHHEADQQFKRDRLVDQHIVKILEVRRKTCIYYHRPEAREKCRQIIKDYNDAVANFFIKYGELAPHYNNARQAYMKQKHRMVWLRRNPDSDLMPAERDPEAPENWTFKSDRPHKSDTVWYRNFFKANYW